jgi:hypothetical protein
MVSKTLSLLFFYVYIFISCTKGFHCDISIMHTMYPDQTYFLNYSLPANTTPKQNLFCLPVICF